MSSTNNSNSVGDWDNAWLINSPDDDDDGTTRYGLKRQTSNAKGTHPKSHLHLWFMQEHCEIMHAEHKRVGWPWQQMTTVGEPGEGWAGGERIQIAETKPISDITNTITIE